MIFFLIPLGLGPAIAGAITGCGDTAQVNHVAAQALLGVLAVAGALVRTGSCRFSAPGPICCRWQVGP